MMLAALVLGGCAAPVVTTQVIPIPTAEPASANSVRPGGTRLMAVDRLYAWCEGERLRVQVSASSNSGGWSEPRLNRVSLVGGLITYEAIAREPRGQAVTMMIQTFTIEFDEPLPYGVNRVRVISQTNEMNADLKIGC
jgi:hypothetical protein